MAYRKPQGFVKVNGEWERISEENKVTKVYDKRHGGAFDRGSADAYYGRSFRPHYFIGATYSSKEILIDDETSEKFEAYRAGYQETSDCKDWN